ncbi:SAM-dependent methyltransferase [Rhizobium leguminosarum]|uniref:SAM-dependent methyltransferase n=1 Tax=Rhizobium leguminosarum TaxID=384 RepID=UPI001C94B149|nr:hypothetical protein [Rhizobium leguminosarum]
MGKVVLIGAGNSIDRHLTLEAAEALRTVDCCFYTDDVVGCEKYCRRHGIVAEKLGSDAVLGGIRSAIHKQWSARILDIAVSADVAWITQGSVSIICGVSRTLLEDAPGRGIRVSLLPGISSVEAMLCALVVNFSAGVSVFEASRLIARKTSPSAAMHCLILQLHRAETWLNPFGQPLRAEALVGLRDLLLGSYPPSHPVCIITCRRESHESDKLDWIKLSDLPQHASAVSPWASLFVPALQEQSIDDEALALLTDYARLEALYHMPISLLRDEFSSAELGKWPRKT